MILRPTEYGWLTTRYVRDTRSLEFLVVAKDCCRLASPTHVDRYRRQWDGGQDLGAAAQAVRLDPTAQGAESQELDSRLR